MISEIISGNKTQPQNRNFTRWATSLIMSNTVTEKLVSMFYILFLGKNVITVYVEDNGYND